MRVPMLLLSPWAQGGPCRARSSITPRSPRSRRRCSGSIRSCPTRTAVNGRPWLAAPVDDPRILGLSHSPRYEAAGMTHAHNVFGLYLLTMLVIVGVLGWLGFSMFRKPTGEARDVPSFDGDSILGVRTTGWGRGDRRGGDPCPACTGGVRVAVDPIPLSHRRHAGVRDDQLGDRPLRHEGQHHVRQGGLGNCSAHKVSGSKTSIAVKSVNEYQWKAKLTGLQPNTQYCYRVQARYDRSARLRPVARVLVADPRRQHDAVLVRGLR